MWLPINEQYEVSLEGQVRNSKTGKVLVLYDNTPNGGYIQLRIGGSYNNKLCRVHKLVSQAFLPSPTEPNCVIDHIDGNRQNNHASNLRWVSVTENNINISIATKPHRDNQIGHHHISIHTDGFVVGLRSKKLNFKHRSFHKTLEEAIVKRDELFAQIGLVGLS